MHIIGIDHQPFTFSKNARGEATEKVAQLHKILDERLAEPPDSIHRMEGVCGLIPSSLDGIDLESYGYHRQCYQRFHRNLNRLKAHESSGSTVPLSKHHSPRRAASVSKLNLSPLFPLECIFCEKYEKKCMEKQKGR